MIDDDVYEAVFRVNICSNCGMNMEIVDKKYREVDNKLFLGVIFACECGNSLNQILIIEGGENIKCLI